MNASTSPWQVYIIPEGLGNWRIELLSIYSHIFDEVSLDQFEDWLSEPNDRRIHFALRSVHGIVAAASCELIGDILTITWFGVHPQWQRKGRGSKLFVEIKRTVVQWDEVAEINLYCRLWNHEGQKFWESLGFKKSEKVVTLKSGRKAYKYVRPVIRHNREEF